MKKRWLITGASRGVGLATARKAIEQGDQVALVARSETVHAAAVALGNNALAFQADVTNSDSLDQITRTIADTWGGIDVLVNNAGLHRGGRVDRVPFEDWQAVLDTNLSGPFRVIRAALPHMDDGGAIINIGAVVGFLGFPGDSPYGASKAGLAGLTKVLAVELAKRRIRVNLVIPGFVMTEMTSGLSEKAIDAVVAKIPLGRVGEDHEIADVIAWVSAASYMTGAIIPTDGGLSCAL